MLEEDGLHAAKVGEYVEYLAEHGIDAYYTEPEPDFDDYIERFLRDPPLHLLGSDEPTLIEFAAEAYIAAHAARSERRLEASTHLMEVETLATYFCMAVALIEHKGAESEAAIFADMRKHIARRFYHEYMWREPWIGLIEGEFPGPELMNADFEAFEASREVHEQEKAAISEKTAAIREELEAFLVANGCIPATQDHLVLMRVVVRVYTNRLGGDASIDVMTQRQDVEELIRRMAFEPDHPAWRVFLDRYFPTPE